MPPLQSSLSSSNHSSTSPVKYPHCLRRTSQIALHLSIHNLLTLVPLSEDHVRDTRPFARESRFWEAQEEEGEGEREFAGWEGYEKQGGDCEERKRAGEERKMGLGVGSCAGVEQDSTGGWRDGGEGGDENRGEGVFGLEAM